MKRFMAVMLAALMVIGLAACSSTPAATTAAATQAATEAAKDEVVTIRWYNGADVDGGCAARIAKFEASHPNIKVEFVECDIDNQIDVIVGSGEVVDLVYTYSQKVYEKAINGGALPVNEYAAAAGDDLVKLFGAGAMNMLNYEGNYYGIPWSNNTFKVFYNKTIMDQKGITIPEVWSIEEFTETAKKLNDPANNFYGCVFPYGWEDLCFVMAQTSGWSFTKKDADGNIVPNFDDPILKKNMEWLYNLSDPNGANVAPSMAKMTSESMHRRQVLASQGTALIIDGPYTLVWLNNYQFNDPGEGALPFELGVAELPYVEEAGNGVAYMALVGAFYIPKTSAHPQEAYEFAKFMELECTVEGSNYMPVAPTADIKGGASTLTTFKDSNGNKHENIFPIETAVKACTTDLVSHIEKFNYDPGMVKYDTVLTALFYEQYSLFFNGEMDFDSWAAMMNELGTAELAQVQ
ncbi:MAG: extracellular solute-binding protein [Lachnospiraceae bacterium]|nr:extracellular solute-binding protein [Lachnospiraceae bacterium]